MPLESRPTPPRDIFIACPWTPKGGGMFKVADYLIQSQGPGGSARLQPLDTRGSGPAALSVLVLLLALLRLVRARLAGTVAGVHVNMAERLSLLRKSAIVLSCRALRLPVVLHLHAAQLHHFYRRLPAPLQRLTRWVFRQASCCVVLGQAGRRFVVGELGVPPERVRVLINGVPEPAVPRRTAPATGTASARRQVLFVGNLSERKGVSDLLAALALPGFDAARTQVRIAGGGDVKHYRERARALGLGDWVHFEGWADQGQVAELMAASDVLVLPSYDEGLPLVILEALAHGLAVVCTPVGEIPDALADGEEALFVPPGDPRALAAQLQRVLADHALRLRLEHRGRARHAADFSMQRFFEGVAAIHRECFGVCAALRPALQPGLRDTRQEGAGGPPSAARATPTAANHSSADAPPGAASAHPTASALAAPKAPAAVLALQAANSNAQALPHALNDAFPPPGTPGNATPLPAAPVNALPLPTAPGSSLPLQAASGSALPLPVAPVNALPLPGAPGHAHPLHASTATALGAAPALPAAPGAPRQPEPQGAAG